MEEVMSYLEHGSTYRHTGSTQMNEYSSRSHAVFTFVIGNHCTVGSVRHLDSPVDHTPYSRLS